MPSQCFEVAFEIYFWKLGPGTVEWVFMQIQSTPHSTVPGCHSTHGLPPTATVEWELQSNHKQKLLLFVLFLNFKHLFFSTIRRPLGGHQAARIKLPIIQSSFPPSLSSSSHGISSSLPSSSLVNGISHRRHAPQGNEVNKTCKRKRTCLLKRQIIPYRYMAY